MTEGAIFGVSQAKVFEVLYKIVDLPFLANYKLQIDVSTFSITLADFSCRRHVLLYSSIVESECSCVCWDCWLIIFLMGSIAGVACKGWEECNSDIKHSSNHSNYLTYLALQPLFREKEIPACSKSYTILSSYLQILLARWLCLHDLCATACLHGNFFAFAINTFAKFLHPLVGKFFPIWDPDCDLETRFLMSGMFTGVCGGDQERRSCGSWWCSGH